MIEQRPLFGWGYGNYDIYDDSFRVVNTPSRNSMKESDHTSHNTYFTVMAEQGIPALVLYLLPTGWWLLMSVAVRRKLPQRGFWSVTLLAVLWLLILDHVTVSSFMDMIRFNLFGTTIYWMALALIATVVESHKYLNQESTETKSINGQSVPGLAKEVSRTW
jgi:O-antigen ligase